MKGGKRKMSNKKFKAIEVALLLNISVPTLNNWYLFKRQNPDNEYAQMLPDPIQVAPRQTRYWDEADIPKLIEFKSNIVWGRSGFMGSVTQKYAKYKKERNNETQKTN